MSEIITNSFILRTASEPVDPKKDNLSMLFQTLDLALSRSQRPGIGLAAVQINILKQASIIRVEGCKLDVWNPKVIEYSGRVISPEGCLSLPGVSRNVLRAEEVTIENGDGARYALSGIEAIVFQHELDHMQGITISDHEARSMKVGRNEKCPCGSGLKFKKCHVDKEVELQAELIRRLK